MADISWEETQSIMAELQAMHLDPADVQAVQDIRSMADKLRKLCDAREGEAKGIIRALASHVKAEEESLEPPHRAEHQQAMAQLAAAKAQAQQGISAQEAAIAHTQVAVVDTANRVQETGRAAKAGACEHEAELPRLQNEVSLYANITKIQFDFSVGGEGTLVGCVACPSRQELRHFCIDTTRGDRFAVANQLWDLVDGAALDAAGAAPPKAPAM